MGPTWTKRSSAPFPSYQYHNGGIWPMIGAFWVMTLAHRGGVEEPRAELELVARANALGEWEFNEWLHGRTGEPSGMKGQSWNAAALLLARQALSKRLFSDSALPLRQ